MLVRVRGRTSGERGAVTVIVGILMVAMLGSAALVFDLSRLRHARHVVQSAVDLGALAGAGFLPVKGPDAGAQAESTARSIAIANAPELASGGLTISFGCVVYDPEGNGGADSPDLKYACGPAAGTWTGGWTSKHKRAYHDCNPYAGDLCNVLKLTASTTVDYWFAPAIGYDQGSTGAIRAVACRGLCGQPSAPLDMMFVLDRTRSMEDYDIANVKNAARSVLQFYNPALQHVGLVGLPYFQPSNPCNVAAVQNYPAPATSTWKMVGLSDDYQLSSGALNPASTLVKTINCMVRTPASVTVNPPVRSPYQSGHTDIGDALAAAGNVLITEGRPDVPKVIVLLTDGESNMPWPNRPCEYADNRASTAKGNAIDIFTLAYGANGARCYNDLSGPWTNAYATRFLAAVATDSIDNRPGGCATTENTDGDNYFCESAATDLEPVFRQVAAQAIQRARLIDF
jgi:Flp pilus assembly protein TadG